MILYRYNYIKTTYVGFCMKLKYFENYTIHLHYTNTTNDNRCTVNCLS